MGIFGPMLKLVLEIELKKKKVKLYIGGRFK